MSRTSRAVTKSPDHARTGTRSTIRNLTRNLVPGVLTTVAVEHGHAIYALAVAVSR